METDSVLNLDKPLSSSPKYALNQICLKLAQWFLRRRWKCEKFTDRRKHRQMTDGLTTVDQKSSLELSARQAKNWGFYWCKHNIFCLGFFSHKRITWGSVKHCKFWPILKGLKALRVTWVSLWEFEVLSLTRL